MHSEIFDFAMHSNFRYDSEKLCIAKFIVLSPALLFHWLPAATVPASLLPACIVPFLQALIFFIPGLLKLIEDHMKLMEINPTLVMIGLTR